MRRHTLPETSHLEYYTGFASGAVCVIIAMSVILLLVLWNPAGAVEYVRGVGVYIDRVCLASPNCVDYSDVIPYDNSSTRHSGAFVEKNGDLVRKSAKYQNSFAYYKGMSKFTVFVDPPQGVRAAVPIITIVSKLDHYTLPQNMSLKEKGNTTIAKATQAVSITFKDRYVNKICTEAIISAKNWRVLLPDTISYMASGCDPAHTKIDTIMVSYKNLTKHDITTSSKYKLEKWQQQIKKECLQKRNACTDIRQPTRGGL